MSINTNWARWIKASIYTYFDTNIDGYTKYFEGSKRDTFTAQDYIEIRMDGPHFSEVSKNYFKITVEVNVVLHHTKDDTQIYKLDTMIGVVSTAFKNIPVYKYGDGAADDSSYLGCLRLIVDPHGMKGDKVVVSNFGQIEAATEAEQATVEGHYVMNLEVS